MDTKELRERLHAYRPTNEWGDGVHHVICTEAADALTTLEAENADLRAKLEQAEVGRVQEALVADVLRAKLERAREALEPFAVFGDFLDWQPNPRWQNRNDELQMGDLAYSIGIGSFQDARSTLSDLTKEPDNG